MEPIVKVIIVVLTAVSTWVALGFLLAWQKWREYKKKWKNYENEYGDV